MNLKIQRNQRDIVIMFFLTMLIFAVYWQVINFNFVDYDDNLYVFNNHFITQGFSYGNIIWAFTSTYVGHWHPLTWLSLILDYKLFGLNAGGYHWTNVILHLINTLLLFKLLQWITAETGKSALVALLFALHPLNVESVAWISERKNVLSMLFFLTTISSFFYYVRCPNSYKYSLIIFCFIAGLMSKPMLVTLPFLLLLLDYWPLKRLCFQSGNTPLIGSEIPSNVSENRQDGDTYSQNQLNHFSYFIKEKIPLFLLSSTSGLITLYAASQGGAIKSLDTFSWMGRFSNAITSYFNYITKMILPVNLSCFYPYQKEIPLWQIIIASLFIIGISGISIFYAKRYRYIFVGWFWYIVTMLPVLGLVQVGYQSMADRYAYIPLIGLFIIIVWGGADLMQGIITRNKYFFYAAVAVIFVILSVLSWNQIGFWRNSETLFRHSLDVTTNNHIAYGGIGKVLLEKGQIEEARVKFLQAIAIFPGYSMAYNNLGIIYMHQKKYDEAINQFQQALKFQPQYVDGYNNMGIALAMKGNYREAILCFNDAIRINPNYKNAKENLSKALYSQKHTLEKR